jgi:hypothetical protein
MKTLHIVTPCSRPNNLFKIYESIKTQRGKMSKTRIIWWIFLDAQIPNWEFVPNGPDIYLTACPSLGRSVVGHNQRNSALEIIKDGWIYFLDDDTLLHPDFWLVEDHLVTEPYIYPRLIYVFNQLDKEGNLRLKSSVENLKVGSIDTGSFIINAKAVMDTLFPLTYEGDGLFIEEIWERDPHMFCFLNLNISYYNYLR